MKHLVKLFALITALCFALLVFTACNDGNAEEELPKDTQITTPNSDRLQFSLKEDDTYEITGYYGTDLHIDIPATYEGKMVTSIGEYAFEYCARLTDISFQGTKEQWNAISKGELLEL